MLNHVFLFFVFCWMRLFSLSAGNRVFNRPFPSSLVPLFQSESKCETILMKTTLICMKMKLDALLISIRKGFALSLVLKQRHRRIRKWPIQFLPKMVIKLVPSRFSTLQERTGNKSGIGPVV